VYISFAMLSLFENMQPGLIKTIDKAPSGCLYVEKENDPEFWLHRSLLKYTKQEAPTEL